MDDFEQSLTERFPDASIHVTLFDCISGLPAPDGRTFVEVIHGYTFSTFIVPVDAKLAGDIIAQGIEAPKGGETA